MLLVQPKRQRTKTQQQAGKSFHGGKILRGNVAQDCGPFGPERWALFITRRRAGQIWENQRLAQIRRRRRVQRGGNRFYIKRQIASPLGCLRRRDLALFRFGKPKELRCEIISLCNQPRLDAMPGDRDKSEALERIAKGAGYAGARLDPAGKGGALGVFSRGR